MSSTKLSVLGLDAAMDMQMGEMHSGDRFMEQRTGQRDRFVLLNNGSPSTFIERSSDCSCFVTDAGYLLRCFDS